jgi:5-methylcytosine-specific restriction endonuclease McrA
MSDFVPNLSASAVDARLRAAVAELRRAEKSAVLWFAELMRRRLYRDCGYSSIHAYAEQVLGFSRNKTFQFIHLAESLEHLPRLRESLTRGELPWTKAREVVKVATGQTEGQWIERAQQLNSRALEARVKEARVSTRALLAEASGQGSLLGSQLAAAAGADPSGSAPGSGIPGGATGTAPSAILVAEAAVTLTLHLRPLDLARLQSMLEKIRKAGGATTRHQTREELLLAGLDALLSSLEVSERSAKESAGGELPRGNSAPPYQVVMDSCEECGTARLPDRRGVAPAMAAQAACDCRTQREGAPNRASIPPALRRQVLARDGHRCQALGCGATRFLEIHRRDPRRKGGRNRAANLITLCSACHRLLHESGPGLAAALPAADLPAAALSNTG